LPAVGIGDELEVDRLEIHHQRIGQDVVGAIRPPVEGARILAAYGEAVSSMTMSPRIDFRP
jgi:hypothetical protein